MAFYYMKDRIINLDKVFQFFIEQDSRSGKFRIFCEMQDRISGAFLYEFDSFQTAATMLMKINDELKLKETKCTTTTKKNILN